MKRYKLEDVRDIGFANDKLLRLNIEDPSDRYKAFSWLGIVLKFQENIFTIAQNPELFTKSYIEATRKIDSIHTD